MFFEEKNGRAQNPTNVLETQEGQNLMQQIVAESTRQANEFWPTIQAKLNSYQNKDALIEYAKALYQDLQFFSTKNIFVDNAYPSAPAITEILNRFAKYLCEQRIGRDAYVQHFKELKPDNTRVLHDLFPEHFSLQTSPAFTC